MRRASGYLALIGLSCALGLPVAGRQRDDSVLSAAPHDLRDAPSPINGDTKSVLDDLKSQGAAEIPRVEGSAVAVTQAAGEEGCVEEFPAERGNSTRLDWQKAPEVRRDPMGGLIPGELGFDGEFCSRDSGYPTGREQFSQRDDQIQRGVSSVQWSAAQRRLLAGLDSLGISAVDLWLGSHIILGNDKGRYYKEWRCLGASPRTSSHYRAVRTPQYEVAFLRHGLLFGLDRDGNTWLQMENHSAGNPAAFDRIIGHCADYIEHLRTGMNIGPLGFSPHRETSNPLLVNVLPR